VTALFEASPGPSSPLWEACGGAAPIRPWASDVVRVVESQEQVATMAIVDTLAEQAQLEELIEATKPPAPEGAGRLHYLLMSPFRYPPLRHGSRFGTRHEPSLFYASLTVDTTLAECAYYRFVFLAGMDRPFSQTLRSLHTTFVVGFSAERAVLLDTPPWTRDRAAISSPTDYTVSQALGAAMRAADVAAFRYRSARDPAGGANAGVFSPASLVGPPRELRSWECLTDPDRVAFLEAGTRTWFSFDRTDFLMAGELPTPAL